MINGKMKILALSALTSIIAGCGGTDSTDSPQTIPTKTLVATSNIDSVTTDKNSASAEYKGTRFNYTWSEAVPEFSAISELYANIKTSKDSDPINDKVESTVREILSVTLGVKEKVLRGYRADSDTDPTMKNFINHVQNDFNRAAKRNTFVDPRIYTRYGPYKDQQYRSHATSYRCYDYAELPRVCTVSTNMLIVNLYDDVVTKVNKDVWEGDSFKTHAVEINDYPKKSNPNKGVRFDYNENYDQHGRYLKYTIRFTREGDAYYSTSWDATRYEITYYPDSKDIVFMKETIDYSEQKIQEIDNRIVVSYNPNTASGTYEETSIGKQKQITNFSVDKGSELTLISEKIVPTK